MASIPRPVMDASALEQAVETLQQRLEQVQAMLAQQQKLATLGMITAVIAHEFNNILTPMISYTRYAMGEKADAELKEKALGKALAGAERAAAISQSLLGFTRPDASTVANVRKAMQETLSCISRDLSKDGITLLLDIDEDAWVAMNGGQLQQVLMNLIVNARAAMLEGRSGGRKLIVCGKTQKTGKIIEISLSDTGKGIDPRDLPHIFEPFFSTKHDLKLENDGLVRGGTGLGLTICQELVSSAGGTLGVESELGRGTKFTIKLPAGHPAGAKTEVDGAAAARGGKQA